MDIIRIVLLLLIGGLFVQQIRRTPAGSNRRRAFTMGALVVGLLLLVQLMVLGGLNVAPLLLPVYGLVVLLLLAGVFFLWRAWRGGEMEAQLQQVRDALADERARRNDSTKE